MKDYILKFPSLFSGRLTRIVCTNFLFSFTSEYCLLNKINNQRGRTLNYPDYPTLYLGSRDLGLGAHLSTEMSWQTSVPVSWAGDGHQDQGSASLYLGPILLLKRKIFFFKPMTHHGEKWWGRGFLFWKSLNNNKSNLWRTEVVWVMPGSRFRESTLREERRLAPHPETPGGERQGFKVSPTRLTWQPAGVSVPLTLPLL